MLEHSFGVRVDDTNITLIKFKMKDEETMQQVKDRLMTEIEKRGHSFNEVVWHTEREAERRLYWYRIGIGVAGCALEYHSLLAHSLTNARDLARALWISPEKGYDHIEVARLKRGSRKCLS